jgi:single-stranded DNA-binding protein
MSINLVVVDGVVKSPALRYGPDGKPEFRFTLVQTENGFPLYLPCCAAGSAAERLASEIDEGQHIVVTSAKLCYRKRTTKLGEQSRLEILVWSVERLTTSAQAERSGEAEGDELSLVPSMLPEPKARRPRYPKWKPSDANVN